MSNGLKTFAIVAVLLALSFFLRWQNVLNTSVIDPIRADAYQYVTIADNLAHHHVFSMTADPAKSMQPVRPPGYPLFLAAIISLTSNFNSFVWTTLLLQCLIGAGTVVLTYVLARYVLPRSWAIIAALLVAFSPHLIILSDYLLTECLYTFLLLAGLVLLVKACRDDTPALYGSAGFLLGLAIFVRPPLALFPFVAGVIIYLTRRGGEEKRRTRDLIAVFLIGCFLLPASWYLWRDISATARPNSDSLLKTALVCGSYPQITYNKSPGKPFREDPNYQKLATSSYPEIISHIIRETMKEPGRYLKWWFIGKPVLFWSWKVFFNGGINIFPVKYSWFEQNGFMSSVKWLMLKIHPFLVILAALTVIFLLKGYRGGLSETAAVSGLLCITLLIYFTLMFIILAPYPRYALPLGPELFTLSVLAVHRLASAGKTIFGGQSV